MFKISDFFQLNLSLSFSLLNATLVRDLIVEKNRCDFLKANLTISSDYFAH